MKKLDGAPADTQLTVAVLPPPSGFDPRALELELWSSIKGSASADDFKTYLDKFPNGTFADVARTRIAALSKTVDIASASGDIKTAEAMQRPRMPWV